MKIQNLKIDFFCIVVFSFMLRMILVVQNPDVYAFDAYIYLLGLSPEYPLFTGFVKLLITAGFSVFAIRIVTAAFASFACFAFYLFALRVLKDKTLAGCATLLMSIYPSFLTFSIVPYTESLFFLMLFSGLWFFEKESETENSRYIGTAIFLGLACLTRYEAWFIPPLIFAKIIIRRKSESVLKKIRLCLSIFWGPLIWLLYKYIFLPERMAHQSGGIQKILKNIFPLLNGLLDSAVTKLIPDLLARDLLFPLIVFFAGLMLSLTGCISAVIRDRNRHLLYILFIIPATAIQLLPIILNYQNFSGKIIGLHRHGMVPLVFLLLYLMYSLDLLIGKLPLPALNQKKYQRVVLIAMLTIFAAASFKTTNYLLSDFRKLYRNSYIEPYWIGKPGDAGAGVIASTSDKTLMAHLFGKSFRLYQPPDFADMSPESIRNFIAQHQIKYVILDRKSFPAFERFIQKAPSSGFRRLASVGGWMFVYVREGEL